MANKIVTDEMKKLMKKLKEKGMTYKEISNEIKQRYGVEISPRTVEYHANPNARRRMIEWQKKNRARTSDVWNRLMRKRVSELTPYIYDILNEMDENSVRSIIKEKLEFPDAKAEELILRAKKYGEKLESEYIPRLEAHKLYMRGKDVDTISKQLGVSEARARHLVNKAKRDAWHIKNATKATKDPVEISKMVKLPFHYVDGHIKLLKTFGVSQRRHKRR